MNFLLEIGCEEIPPLWIEPALEQLKNKFCFFLEKEGFILNSIKTYGTPRRLALVIRISRNEKIEEVIKGKLFDIIKGIRFPKSMRWKTNFTFARPIRWIVAMLNDKIIDFELEGVISSNKTYIGRKKEPVVISKASSYVSVLKENGIIGDCKERKRYIQRMLKIEADKLNAKPYLPPILLDKISNVVEKPFVIRGRFKKKFLKLPDCVLKAALIHHQMYIPLIREKSLIPYFLVVSEGGEKKEIIRKGHERVVSARLYDAEFFIKSDLKISLEEFSRRLKGVVFHEGLGSLYDKTMRNVRLSTSIALRLMEEKDIKDVSKASFLCKLDLTSQMVQEFPELQGIMGYYYAIKKGIPKKIAIASAEHYLDLPKSYLSRITNLADRVDTLVGYFSIGIIPKGSYDPYGLRRCGNSIIKIILLRNFKMRISLGSLIREASKEFKIKEEIVEKILLFLRQRLEFILKEKYPLPLINACLSIGFDDIIDAKERIEALTSFAKEEDFGNLIASFKRIVNILKGKEVDNFDESLLRERAEKNLYLSFLKGKEELEDAISKKNYKNGFKILAEQRKDIDTFFDEVLVMDPDKEIATNRLSLLFNIKKLFLRLADISVLK